MDLLKALIIPGLVLAGLLPSTARAQEPGSSASPASAASPTANSTSAKKASGSERVILKVGNVQVTEAEFEAGIGDIEPQADPDKEGGGPKNRRLLGDDYASVLMLSQQAAASHLDTSPEISRQLAIDRMQVLSDAEFASLMLQTQPTPEEIRQFYSAHSSDYEQVRIRRLFIWKTGAGSKNSRGMSQQEARSRANAILAAAAGSDATKLAESFRDSKDGMLDKDPLVFPRGELPPNMERVAFGIKEGAWSEVEDTPDSLILIQLVKRNLRPLDEVSSLVEKRVQAEKMQAKMDDLKKNTGIWMDEKYFGTAVAPVPGAQQPVSNPPSKHRKSTGKKEESTNEDVQRQ